MIESVTASTGPMASPTAMDPAQRARLIYHQAQAQLSTRLWQAALGQQGPERTPLVAGGGDAGDMPLHSLVALMGGDDAASALLASLQRASQPTEPVPAPPEEGERSGQERGAPDDGPAHPASATGLGPNAAYAGTLQDAATRTRVPAGVLGAIVNAEAARDGEGRWLTYSRNPRSSAAGLGQFLSGTWIKEAERAGTFLNGLARSHGWLDERGHVRRDAKSALLEQRYDGATSIHAIADYARRNLDRLGERGLAVGGDATRIAQAAYLGHHLGLGDAARFLQGGLSEDRAQQLLGAQVGQSAANRRIAAAGGSAASAHRAWLLHYVDSNLRPMAVPARTALS